MKRLLSCVLTAALLLSTAAVFAKTINLYSEPKADSKISGSVNTETGITIVYTPKNSEWIKVANPTNGDVGWVKSSDLGGNGYTMRIFNSGDGMHQYNVYQFGTENKQYNEHEFEKQVHQFEQQQHMMQMHMKQLFNDFFYFPQPVFIPVVMMPKQVKEEKSLPATSSQPTQAAPTQKK